MNQEHNHFAAIVLPCADCLGISRDTAEFFAKPIIAHSVEEVLTELGQFLSSEKGHKIAYGNLVFECDIDGRPLEYGTAYEFNIKGKKPKLTKKGKWE